MIRYHARWVLPISRPPIAHGTVVEHDGRIAYVGERTGAPQGTNVDPVSYTHLTLPTNREV